MVAIRPQSEASREEESLSPSLAERNLEKKDKRGRKFKRGERKDALDAVQAPTSVETEDVGLPFDPNEVLRILNLKREDIKSLDDIQRALGEENYTTKNKAERGTIASLRNWINEQVIKNYAGFSNVMKVAFDIQEEALPVLEPPKEKLNENHLGKEIGDAVSGPGFDGDFGTGVPPEESSLPGKAGGDPNEDRKKILEGQNKLNILETNPDLLKPEDGEAQEGAQEPFDLRDFLGLSEREYADVNTIIRTLEGLDTKKFTKKGKKEYAEEIKRINQIKARVFGSKQYGRPPKKLMEEMNKVLRELESPDELPGEKEGAVLPASLNAGNPDVPPEESSLSGEAKDDPNENRKNILKRLQRLIVVQEERLNILKTNPDILKSEDALPPIGPEKITLNKIDVMVLKDKRERIEANNKNKQEVVSWMEKLKELCVFYKSKLEKSEKDTDFFAKEIEKIDKTIIKYQHDGVWVNKKGVLLKNALVDINKVEEGLNEAKDSYVIKFQEALKGQDAQSPAEAPTEEAEYLARLNSQLEKEYGSNKIKGDAGMEKGKIVVPEGTKVSSELLVFANELNSLKEELVRSLGKRQFVAKKKNNQKGSAYLVESGRIIDELVELMTATKNNLKASNKKVDKETILRAAILRCEDLKKVANLKWEYFNEKPKLINEIYQKIEGLPEVKKRGDQKLKISETAEAISIISGAAEAEDGSDAEEGKEGTGENYEKMKKIVKGAGGLNELIKILRDIGDIRDSNGRVHEIISVITVIGETRRFVRDSYNYGVKSADGFASSVIQYINQLPDRYGIRNAVSSLVSLELKALQEATKKVKLEKKTPGIKEPKAKLKTVVPETILTPEAVPVPVPKVGDGAIPEVKEVTERNYKLREFLKDLVAEYSTLEKKWEELNPKSKSGQEVKKNDLRLIAGNKKLCESIIGSNDAGRLAVKGYDWKEYQRIVFRGFEDNWHETLKKEKDFDEMPEEEDFDETLDEEDEGDTDSEEILEQEPQETAEEIKQRIQEIDDELKQLATPFWKKFFGGASNAVRSRIRILKKEKNKLYGENVVALELKETGLKSDEWFQIYRQDIDKALSFIENRTKLSDSDKEQYVSAELEELKKLFGELVQVNKKLRQATTYKGTKEITKSTKLEDLLDNIDKIQSDLGGGMYKVRVGFDYYGYWNNMHQFF